MEIPAGSLEDERHKQATYFAPVIFSRGSSGFQSFPFFLNSTPSASWLFVKAAHARARRILSQFCFSSKFDFQKIAAPAVANWRCQFAKFSSRVQIEPNARMLVNINTKIPQSRRLWFVKSGAPRQTFEAETLVIGKSFKWCGCRLFVCFLICFCHEGGLWGQAGGVLVAASCPGLSAELPLCPASVYPWTCPWAQCTSASKPAGCPGARTQWWTVKQSGGRVYQSVW